MGINYEAMPVGKKSVLAPINSNMMMDASAPAGNPALTKMSLETISGPNSSVVTRKNNRTLKPLQR